MCVDMLIVDMHESDSVEQSHISTKKVGPIYQVRFLRSFDWSSSTLCQENSPQIQQC